MVDPEGEISPPEIEKYGILNQIFGRVSGKKRPKVNNFENFWNPFSIWCCEFAISSMCLQNETLDIEGTRWRLLKSGSTFNRCRKFLNQLITTGFERFWNFSIMSNLKKAKQKMLNA